MAARLSEAERTELEGRRARLQLELRLIEGELRTDEVLRVQAAARPVARPSVVGGARAEYLRRLYGGR
jgi:hypothetical protein